MSDKEKTIKIDRNELYEKVWKLPVSRLAKQYEISDVGLSKVCRKLRVPKPPRGYWTKIKFGKKVRKIAMPELRNDEPSTYTIRIQPLSGTILKLNSKFDELVIAESKSEKRITVPGNLKSPHLLVKETRKILEKRKPDDYGVLYAWRNKSLSISVSPRCLNRALRIMDAIIKEFESKGFRISAEADETSRLPSTYVEILGEKVHFSMAEKIKRIDHVPTRKEIEEQKKYSWMTPRCWDYVPTGKLALKIEAWGAYGRRKKWSDSPNKCLEDKLNDFIVGAVTIAGILRQERLEREEEQKKWEEEQRRREEEEKRRRVEEERLHGLENQALQWAKSQQLRAYIRAFEMAALARRCSEDFQKRIEEWLSWAREHADRLDPLKKGLPLKGD